VSGVIFLISAIFDNRYASSRVYWLSALEL